jgi:hypothetical protein
LYRTFCEDARKEKPHFQRAGIQYINSLTGKQVRISIVDFPIKIGEEIQLKNTGIAGGCQILGFVLNSGCSLLRSTLKKHDFLFDLFD